MSKWFAKEPRSIAIFILTCANRWGKSVEISCIQLWFLFYKVGIPESEGGEWLKTEYRTANIAPHSALTEPVFKTMHQILTSSFSIRDPKTGRMTVNQCLVEWWYLKDRTLNTPPYKMFFDNNSYIEHRSLGADQGDSLQGKPFGLITYDEGGRSDHLKDEMDDSLLARLFDMQGPLMVLSTPSINSKSNLDYYQLYQRGILGAENTYTMTGSLRDNEFFSEEQIQAQYDLLKDNPLRDQMLEGKFVFGGDALFPLESVLAAQDESLNDGVRYEEGHRYVFGTDTAIGSDEMVHYVIDVTSKPWRIVRFLAAKGNSKSPQMHLNDYLDLLEPYYKGDNMWGMLETWNGESIRFYMDLPAWLQSITETYGSWGPTKRATDNQNEVKARPNNSKKSDMLISLKKTLSEGNLKIPKNNTKLANQLSIYQENDKKLDTDHVMALALAVHKARAMDALNTTETIHWESISW